MIPNPETPVALGILILNNKRFNLVYEDPEHNRYLTLRVVDPENQTFLNSAMVACVISPFVLESDTEVEPLMDPDSTVKGSRFLLNFDQKLTELSRTKIAAFNAIGEEHGDQIAWVLDIYHDHTDLEELEVLGLTVDQLFNNVFSLRHPSTVKGDVSMSPSFYEQYPTKFKKALFS